MSLLKYEMTLNFKNRQTVLSITDSCERNDIDPYVLIAFTVADGCFPVYFSDDRLSFIVGQYASEDTKKTRAPKPKKIKTASKNNPTITEQKAILKLRRRTKWSPS